MLICSLVFSEFLSHILLDGSEHFETLCLTLYLACDLEYVCELYLFYCPGAFRLFFSPLFPSLSFFRTALHFLLLKLVPDFFGSPQHLRFIQEKWSPFSANSLHIAAYLSFYWRQNKTSKTLKKLEHPFSPFQLTPTSVYLGSNLRFIWWNM